MSTQGQGPVARVTARTPPLFLLAIAASALLGLYRVRTFDTFFHLAAGRWILEQRALPAVDPFSFTFRGAPWQNHSWGYQALVALLERGGGFAALSLLQASLAGAVSALSLCAIRRDPSLLPWGAPLAVLSVAGFREVLEARPHMLAYVCAALSLRWVQSAYRGDAPRALAWLIPVYLLWVCVHGSHVLVFVVLALGIVACLIARKRRHAIWLLIVLGACLSCGLALAPSAFLQGGEHVASSFLETSVQEWAPVTSELLFTTFQGRTFLLLAILAVVGVANEAQKPPDTRAHGHALAGLLLCPFALLAFTSARMLALFALAAGPVWLPLAARALAALASRARFAARPTALVSALGVALIAGGLLVLDRATFRPGAGLMEERLPRAALRSMRARGRVRRVYNAYNFGAFLIWERYPEAGVFVDGRAITVYPAAFLAAFELAYRDPRVFELLASRYAIDGVLLPSHSPRTQRLLAYLKTQPRFRLSHQDAVATVFELR